MTSLKGRGPEMHIIGAAYDFKRKARALTIDQKQCMQERNGNLTRLLENRFSGGVVMENTSF